MDQQRIDEIRAREQAATPGEWGRYGWMPDGRKVPPIRGAMESAPGLSIGSVTHTEPIARFSGYLLPVEANVEFVIHARSDIPDLLDALAASEARLAVLTEALGWYADGKTWECSFPNHDIHCGDQDCGSPSDLDQGDRARAALTGQQQRGAGIRDRFPGSDQE